MKRQIYALVALVALPLVTLAAPASAAPDLCLRQSQIRGFSASDDKSLIVDTIGHTKFRVNMLGGCPDLSWKDAIGFKTFAGGQLACVSRGDTMLSRDFGGGGPKIGNRCIVASVEAYTPAMAHADAVNKAMNAPH